MKQRFSLFLAVLFAASAASLAQSLADVARKTREDDKKPVRVFTDADLPARSSSTASAKPVVSGATSVATAKAADTESGSAPARSRKAEAKQISSSSAKSAIAEIKKKIDHYTQERDGWKTSVQRYENLLQDETSEFRRQTYQEALDADRHNVELYQQKIDDLQSQLTKAQQASGSSSQGSDDQAGSGGHR